MRYIVGYINLNLGTEVSFEPVLSDFPLNQGDCIKVRGIDEYKTVSFVKEFDDETMVYSLNNIKKVEYVVSKEELLKSNDSIGFYDIDLDIEIEDDFYYVNHHADLLARVSDDVGVTDISFIKSITLTNNLDQILAGLTLEISFSNDVIEFEKLDLPNISSGSKTSIKVPYLNVDLLKLKEVIDIKPTNVIFTVKRDNVALITKSYDFNIMPLSILSNSDSRLVLKYIMPLLPEVKSLALSSLAYNDNNAILAYQNSDRNQMLKEINAVYLAIHNQGIVYQNPASLPVIDNDYKQRIRMPQEVLNDKSATCIDISILFASVLESLGYKPIYASFDRHVMVGVILNSNSKLFQNGALNSVNLLYNYATKGDYEIVLIDSVCALSTSSISFMDSIKSAEEYLKNYEGNVEAFDVSYFHEAKSAYRPIDINDDKVISNLIDSKVIDSHVDSIKYNFINVEKKEEKNRFTYWEKKLLDLTESNPLIDLCLGISNSIRLYSKMPLFSILEKNNEIKIDSFVKLDSGSMLRETINSTDKISSLDVLTEDSVTAIGLENTLKALIKKNKSALDETGSKTLYLSMGIITYTKKDNTIGKAPFMVLPVDVSKGKNKEVYKIKYDYDDVMLNQTFFEYYLLSHPGFDFSNLYGVGSTYSYKDIVYTFKNLNTHDVKLEEDSYVLSNLTFGHYIMWKDIHTRRDELKKNKIVDSIIKNQNVVDDIHFGEGLSLDEKENYRTFVSPLPYDSTQLKAILDCGDGNSFILDGPPGTGKSQTIVNMIVNAFYQGKTVLFIAEKKAALDVVYDRLKKIKLDRFALELHSNKANKSDFLDKLKESNMIGETIEPSNFYDTIKSLEAKKLSLLDFLDKVYKRTYYFSLYDSITIMDYIDIEPYKMEHEYLYNYNDELGKKVESLISDLESYSKSIRDYKNLDIRYLGYESLTLKDRECLKDEFIKFSNIYDDLMKSLHKLLNKINIDIEIDNINVSNVLSLLDIALNDEIYLDTISEFYGEYDLERINKAFNLARNLNSYILEHSTYDYNLINSYDLNKAVLDLSEEYSFFKGLSVKSKYKKEISKLTGYKVKSKNLLKELSEIRLYLETRNEIVNFSNDLNTLLGFDFIDQIKNVDSIEKKVNNTFSFIDNVTKLYERTKCDDLLEIFTDINKNKECINEYNSFIELFSEYKKSEDIINSKYHIRYKYLDEKKFESLLESLSCGIENDYIISLGNINRCINELERLGLNEFIDNIILGNLDISEFKNKLDKSLAYGFITLYFDDPNINSFNSSYFEREIEEYRELINEFNNLSIEEVSYKLSKKIYDNNHNILESNRIGMLKKIIQNHGRGTTIRNIISDYNNVIKNYFPLFLMSPLSAAQYLDINNVNSKFDIVIFDEASQIPTHEAIGAIARGNSLVVAGDEMQMPPSNYFNSNINVDLEFEDSPSLLDECIAIGFERIKLKFHYRSKHESLIEFSNLNFYNHDLYTFPSVDSKDSKVKFKFVDTEIKATNAITKEEISTIVDTIKDIYSNPSNKDKTLGIIVFNILQAEKLEQKLNDYLLKDKELKNILDSHKDPYFIKSLENVQGDERDIIILSIGFGKNSRGYASITGPITRPSGEKRLNVAVSRSKEEMYVISTIKSSDFMSDDRIESRGALMLKKFLEFAEISTFDIKEEKLNDSRSIANLIKKELEAYGYEATCDLGFSKIKVDLAIKDKNSDLYILGVLIDTSMIEDTSLRDRLYVNDFMLNGLKWKTINIYSLDFFNSKEHTIERILSALNEPFKKKVLDINPDIKACEKKDYKYKVDDYIEAFKKPIVISDSKISDVKYLESIVNLEGPISFNRIKSIIKESSGLKSLSSKMIKNLESDLIGLGAIKVLDQDDNVFYKFNDIYTPRFISNRDLYDISKEELGLVFKEVWECLGVGILDEDLYREVLKVIGYDKALTKKAKERLDYVKSYMIINNLI